MSKQVSKPKPTQRGPKRSVSEASSDVRDHPGGGRRRITIATTLAMMVLLGLGLRAFLSRQVEPEQPDFPALESPPIQQPENRYGGPAAFTFTLENAATSPDGRVNAWSYEANDVVLCGGVWGGAAPDLSNQMSLIGHTAPVRALAFSHLGNAVASGSADQTVKVWDVGSGQEIVTLRGHEAEVTAVAFAPDGVSMATGSRDNTVRLWDSFGGLPLVTLHGHTGPVTALAYSFDGKLLASASEDKTIKIWEMETGQQTGSLDIGDQPVKALVFSPTQLLLVSSDGGNSVRLWNVHDQAEIGRLDLPQSNVLSAAFSGDGSALAVAGVDGRIIVRSLVGGQVIADFEAPHTPMFLQYGPDNSLLWSRFLVEHLAQVGATDLVGKLATANQSAEKAIVGFGVADNIQVELFANEALVSNPAAICRDDQGRIFVAETFRFDTEVSLGYAGREIWLLDDLANQSTADRLAMYEKYQDKTDGGMHAHRKFSERIRRLEDRDGDGRADHATIFADQFNDPLTGTGTGLIHRDGDIYYTCIPTLWKLTDTNDDGSADQREALLTGFGVNASLPHGLHGLAWGPDGKLYFSIGDRGLNVATQEGPTLQLPATGAVLRCNPDGTELEEVARGFRNPQELAFDERGNLFTCDNNSNLGDKSRVVYVVPGGDSGWHMSYETMPDDFPLGPWNMDKMWETADAARAAWVLPPLAHVGSGPAGLAFYPGIGLEDRYQNHFFLCDFADAPEVSGVRSFALDSLGAGFQIRDQHTFVSNMLPTDIEFGLDQKIYISDWIRGAMSDGLGRIYKFSSPQHIDAAVVKETQRLLGDGMSDLTDDDLIRALGHRDMRVRQRAHFRLAGRGSQVIPMLDSTARQDKQLLARLHAIWALGMIGRARPDALDKVAGLLDDRDAEVRAQAAKILGEASYQAAAEELIGLLEDESLRVRAFAACALGQMKQSTAIGPIVEMLRDNDDQDVFLRHAGVYALYRIGDADAVDAHAKDQDASVRLAVLLALRRFQDDRVAQFLDDPLEPLVVEAARAVHDLPIEAAYEKLAGLLSSSSQDPSLLRRAINANYRLGEPEHARALTQFVAGDAPSDTLKTEAIRALADWTSTNPRDRVLGFVRPLAQRDAEAVAAVIGPWLAQTLARPDAPLQHELILAASKLAVAVGDVGWITDTQRDVQVRSKLLDMMDQRNDDQLQQAIDAALATDEPGLRVHAARLLARLDTARAVDALSDILVQGTTEEQQFALTTLASIPATRVDVLLAQWLDQLQQGLVAPAIKYEVISAASERQNPMVQEKLAALIRFLAQKPTLAERYQAVLEGGSARRGRALFENHTAAQCLRCHAVDGKGGKVGPDLSKIGAKFPREYLLESLLDPELKIAKGYEGVLISTLDGRILNGILKQETETELQIVDASGELLTIDKAEIDQRQGGKSVMPGNLLRIISSSDLRDLVEYLASLK